MTRIKRIFDMVRFNTFRTFRSPGNIIMLVIAPVMFGLVIAWMYSSGTPGMERVYVVNESDTVQSQAVLDGLADTPYRVHEVTRDEAITDLSAGKYPVAIVIPTDFTASPTSDGPFLEILHTPEYTGSMVESRSHIVAQAVLNGTPIPDTVAVYETPRGSEGDRSFAQVRGVFGVYMLFAMSALFVRGGMLHKEREEGTLQRLVASGIPYGDIVAAHAIGIAVIGVFQAAIVLTITGWLGTLWLGAGWVTLALTLIGAIFVSAGLSMALSGVTRTEAQMQGLAAGIPPLLAMAGGAYFSLETAPGAMQQLATINPIYWALDALEAGYLYEGVASQALPLAILMLIGIFGLVVGVQGLRRHEL